MMENRATIAIVALAGLLVCCSLSSMAVLYDIVPPITRLLILVIVMIVPILAASGFVIIQLAKPKPNKNLQLPDFEAEDVVTVELECTRSSPSASINLEHDGCYIGELGVQIIKRLEKFGDGLEVCLGDSAEINPVTALLAPQEGKTAFLQTIALNVRARVISCEVQDRQIISALVGFDYILSEEKV